MARFSAIVFDVGGTLIYPAEPIGVTYARFALNHGLTLEAEATTTAFREAFKASSPRTKETIPTNGDDRVWWKQVVKKSILNPGFADSSPFEAFFEEVYLHYAKSEAWGIYPEVIEVLRSLRDLAVDLTVLSNWDARLHSVLDGSGLGEFFTHRFISSELGWEKPDPAIYRHVADILRLSPQSLLSAGDDARNDVEGPRKVGWKAVQISRPKTDLGAVLQIMEKK